jgi:GNAT superfamily N-acetyltransferase
MSDLASTIVVRNAVEEDAALIAALIHELAAYERQPEACRATEEAVKRQLFTPDPPADVVIAECDGAPAGFALHFRTFSTWECSAGIWLEDLFVRPEFRTRGVGRALLSHLARLALALGFRRLDFSVLAWNRLAIDFYAGNGAKEQREWRPYRIDGEALVTLGR